MQGKVLIFAAPSGAGKTTIVQHLLKSFPQLGFSISACTRPPRAHELHGKDYYFLSIETFKQKIENIELIEWQEVYKNSFYGTLKSEVERLWQEGKHIVFDVDVQGAIHLKQYFKERALAVFIAVPSIDILEERLRNRGTETDESLRKRVAKADFELTFQDQFDVVLMNENLEQTLIKAQQVVQDFLAKKLLKDVYFSIQSDQWGDYGILIKTNGRVSYEIEDRKENYGESKDIGTWQAFLKHYANDPAEPYQKAALFIKENLI